MTNSKNHKFEDIYKEFEDKAVLKNSTNKESTKYLKGKISSHILDYFEDKYIEEITYDTVENYKTFRKSEISNKPKNKGKDINKKSFAMLKLELNTLRKFFEFCLKQDLTNINPVKIEKPNKIRFKKYDKKDKISLKIDPVVYVKLEYAFKKYEEKRSLKLSFNSLINDILYKTLNDKEFINSFLIYYKKDEKIEKSYKIYNFIFAEVKALDLDRNLMLNYALDKELEEMDKAYNKNIDTLISLTERRKNEILELKKLTDFLEFLFTKSNNKDSAINSFAELGLFNFLNKLHKDFFAEKIDIIIKYSSNEPIIAQEVRRKALQLQPLEYKKFYLERKLHDKYTKYINILKNNNYDLKYSDNDLINLKLFNLVNNPEYCLFLKDKLDYFNNVLNKPGTQNFNPAISVKKLMNKNKYKQVDWNKTVEAIIEATIILLGEELQDTNLLHYIPKYATKDLDI